MAVRQRLRVAVIGCGAIAESAHLPNLLTIPAATLVAICDTDPARLELMGRQFNVASSAWFTDHDQLLADTALDAVIVATPAASHTRIVLDSLAQRIPTFVEKPMTLSVADAETVVAAASRHHTPVMVGYQLRFLPNHVKVKSLITSGEIGDILSAHMRAETLVIKPAETLLIDYGTHFYDLARWYFNAEQIVRVHCMIKRDSSGQQVGATVTLLFSSGCHASVETYWVPRFNWSIVDRSVEFLGTRGKIWTKMSGPDVTLWRSESTRDRFFGRKTFMPGETPTPHTPLSDIAYRSELRSFLMSVLHGDPVAVTAMDGLEALRVADLALTDAITHE